MAFTVLLFSCSKDAMDDELLPVTRAQLSIGLEDKSEVERQEEIKSIRFIVFSNASGDVKLNVNKTCYVGYSGHSHRYNCEKPRSDS